MVLSMERWVGKAAMVTGASSGIGREIAKRLVEEGVTVVGLARRNDQMEELAQQLANAKGKLHAFKADVSKEEDIANAFKWINANVGPIHILINNAGIHIRESLIDGHPDNWKKTFQVNVIGLSMVTQKAVQVMIDNNIDGHVVHINSIGGHRPINLPKMGAYPASKYAVTALADTLRNELNAMKSRIKVTSISPGAVDTPIFDENIRNSEVFKELIGDNFLKTEDVADAIIYTLSTPPHVQVHELTIQVVNEVF